MNGRVEGGCGLSLLQLNLLRPWGQDAYVESASSMMKLDHTVIVIPIDTRIGASFHLGYDGLAPPPQLQKPMVFYMAI